MKQRSKTEKQKANNRKIQRERERESRNIVDLKYIFPSWPVLAPLPSLLV